MKHSMMKQLKRRISYDYYVYGAIQVLRNADRGGGGLRFSGKKRYEGVMFNVISVTRGWVGVQFPEKKRYVTLEWPLCSILLHLSIDLYLHDYTSIGTHSNGQFIQCDQSY